MQVAKCCPLGQLLGEAGECAAMLSGTALPRVFLGPTNITSFKQLADLKLLRPGARPRCHAPQAVETTILS